MVIKSLGTNPGVRETYVLLESMAYRMYGLAESRLYYKVVMVKFGSEPWFKPERNRTERQIRVDVRPLDPDRTDGSVQGSANPCFSENASERGSNPNPSLRPELFYLNKTTLEFN